MKKIVLTGLFVFGLMFAGTSVNAMGGEVHLVGRDGVVMNQLKYTQTLRRGTVNANVLALQKKLKEFGFYHKALDSDYGSGTIAGVMAFQRAKGLKVDGIAGPKTYAMVLATDAFALGITPTKLAISDTACTKEYAPVCATAINSFAKDLLSSTRPQTFSNSCMAGLASAKILYKGKCQTTKPIDGIKERVSTLEYTLPSLPYHQDVTNFKGGYYLPQFSSKAGFFVHGYNQSAINSERHSDSYSDIDENKTPLIPLTLGSGFFSTAIDSTEIDLHTKYYYMFCAEYGSSESNRDISCGSVKYFKLKTDISFQKPEIETEPATGVTAYHAYLNGTLDDLGDADEVEAFFVIAHDDENIDDIETQYGSFSSIQQNGLLKIYFDDIDDEDDFTKYITGYVNNNTNYYRACGQYEDPNGNDRLVCGDIEEFTTPFSGSNGGDCLRIQSGSSNKAVHIGNTTDFTTFELENICDDDIEINKIEFKVISSYNKAQIEDIYIEIDSDEFDEGIDIEQSYNSYVGGPALIFEANGNFDLESGEKVDLEIGGDIESIYSGWNGVDRHFTAFAISLDSIEFEYNNEEEVDYKDYWSNLVVVDY